MDSCLHVSLGLTEFLYSVLRRVSSGSIGCVEHLVSHVQQTQHGEKVNVRTVNYTVEPRLTATPE